MLSIEETLQRQAATAVGKAALLKRPLAMITASLFGGAFIGVGGLLMLSAAGPLVEAGDALAKILSGLVFSAGLVLVVFAGAELVTSTMMTGVQGAAMRAISAGKAATLIVVTFVLNVVGALIFSALAAAAGLVGDGTPARAMLAGLLEARAEQTALELTVRGIMCNVLVCLAVWMSARITHAGAKIAVIIIAITAFVASGFEHVVANMSFYWLGVFAGDPNATATLFAGNMLWVGLGNLIGGSLVVGLGYWLIGGSPRFIARASNEEAKIAA